VFVKNENRKMREKLRKVITFWLDWLRNALKTIPTSLMILDSYELKFVVYAVDK
jgi:hypothetical protein